MVENEYLKYNLNKLAFQKMYHGRLKEPMSTVQQKNGK